MLEGNQKTFSKQDFDLFRSWIDLNEDAVTWQGRYRKEFESFWTLFFIDNLTLAEVMKRFDYGVSSVKAGPIRAWFSWLKTKFICFVFIHQDKSIREVAREGNLELSRVSTALRNHFLESYPYLDDELSVLFQNSNYSSLFIELDFKLLVEKLDLDESELLSVHPEDVMKNMEITLYGDWLKFIKKMEFDFKGSFNLKKVKQRSFFKSSVRVVRDAVFLTIACGSILYGVKEVNKWYKQYLVDAISIYEPQLSWLDRTLTFQSVRADSDQESVNLAPEEIESILDEADFTQELSGEELVFDTESELILTSWDVLPRDFSVVDLERSEFEEIVSGGYRDTRYGNRTVYRVMMTSTNSYDSRAKLNALVDLYSALKADAVRPGQFVPGGVYYNLFVPQEYLKEFLTRVVEVDDAVIYESRTRAFGRVPEGHSKVFIWMKTL